MASLARHTIRLVTVMVVMASCLRLLDAVPRFLTGLPRGVVSVTSLAELRLRTGSDVPMPSYYPATLDWPPRQITIYRGQETAVTIRQRATGAPWLIIVSGAPGATGISPVTLPHVTVLQDTDAVVEGRAAQVQRVSDSSGAVWHQLTWRQASRTMVVRYRGALDELLRIAASLRAGSTA